MCRSHCFDTCAENDTFNGQSVTASITYDDIVHVPSRMKPHVLNEKKFL